MDQDLRDRLRGLLLSGPVLGAEVDLRYRVLALTIEPPARSHPDVLTPERDTDLRVQVLFHPVGTIAARLVRHADGPGSGGVVLRFEPDQLPDVVAALDGPVPIGEPFPGTLPDLHAMEERLSLRGMAQVAEGHDHPLAVSLVADDLTLDLWATFDHVEVRRPDASIVASLTTSDGGAGSGLGSDGLVGWPLDLRAPSDDQRT